MASLSDIYIKKEVLEAMLTVVKARDLKGVAVTISTNDESNQWGQNVSAYVSQTEEERKDKKDKFYVGNGRVFWTDGKVIKGEKKEEQQHTSPALIKDDDDLPF